MLTGLCLVLLNVSFAQNIGHKIGIQGSIGQSYLSIYPEDLYEFGPLVAFQANQNGRGHGFGFSYTNQLSPYFAWVSGLNVISKSSVVKGHENPHNSSDLKYRYTEYYSINQLELPILFKASIGVANTIYLKGYTGVGGNINLSTFSSRFYGDSAINSQYGYKKESLPFNSTEMAIYLGMGLDIQLKESLLQLDLRRSEGITYLGEITQGTKDQEKWTVMSSYIFFSIGYSVPLNQFKKAKS